MGAVMADRVARYVSLIEAPDTLDVLCQRVADEGSLVDICRSLDVPHGRVLTWLMADAARYAVYQRALEVYAHSLVAETVKLADGEPRAVLDGAGKPMMGEDGKPLVIENDVPRDKLRVETRFRVAKHHAPSVYGEKIEHQHKGAPVFVVNIVGSAVPPREIDVTPEVVPVDDTVL